MPIVLNIQKNFKNHLDLQLQRKEVMSHFWDINVLSEINEEKEGTKKYEDRQYYID